MGKIKLRPYQKFDYKELKKILKNNNHVLFGAVTGYGKSVLLSKLVAHDLKNGRRVLVVAPRRKLIRQLSTTLEKFTPSILMSGVKEQDVSRANLILASTPTLHNRLKRYGNYIGKIDRIYIDEVHINFGQTTMHTIASIWWKTAKWVGLSATPIDEKGYRLEGWDHTFYNHQAPDLIKMGYLCDVEVMVEDIPKGLDRVKITAGDYNEKELSALMNESAKIRNVYEIWEKYAQGRKTMIFAVNIAHAARIAESFESHGVEVGLVHSGIKESTEELTLEAFSTGSIKVIVNVGKLTTGYDEPSVDCLLLARPTKSLRLALQIIGRGLRLYPGKSKCQILDLAGITKQHGYPTQRRDFNKIKPPKKSKKTEEDSTTFKVITCPFCKVEQQLRNCERNVIESEETTITQWMCLNCGEVIDEKIVDHRKVDRLRKLQNINDISEITNKDVIKYLRFAAKSVRYRLGWAYHVMSDIKNNDGKLEAVKIEINKHKNDLILMSTFVNNVKKIVKG